MPETSSPSLQSESEATSSSREASDVWEPSPQLSEYLAVLTPPQQKVLEQLSSGSTIRVAAAQAHVCRMTVYRWINSDAPFRAAYTVWQRELLESARLRLIGILDDAVDTIQDSIVQGDVEAAILLARDLGALRRPRFGPTDTQQIARRFEVKRLREDNETERLEAQALLGPVPADRLVANAAARGVK